MTEIIPDEFWNEIQHFSRIIIPVSGGLDSTIVAYEFYRRGIEAELLWNNTIRSLKTARDILVRLFKMTGWPFYMTYPQEKQNWITKKTQRNIQRILDGEIQMNKKNIPCCYYLKEKPAAIWLREHTDRDALIILSIAGYEGMQRQIRLGEIRNRNTFLRFKKKEKRWYGYPLRDYTSRKISWKKLTDYVATTPFFDVKPSGCHTCPIVYFNPKSEPNKTRVKASRAVYGRSVTS